MNKVLLKIVGLFNKPMVLYNFFNLINGSYVLEI